MTEEQLDVLSDFIHDALNGHEPDSVVESDTVFVGDFEIVGEKPLWVEDYNSEPMIRHEWLEDQAYTKQRVLADGDGHKFEIEQVIRIKGTNQYVFFKGLGFN